MKYDGNGDVVLATAGTDIPVGIALIESGYNDISGTESGKVAKGDDIDIQVKDIGFVMAGATITKRTGSGLWSKRTGSSRGSRRLCSWRCS